MEIELYSFEPFLDQIFNFLNFYDLIKSIRSMNKVTRDLNFIFFLYRQLQLKNRITITNKLKMLSFSNRKYFDTVFIEPLRISLVNQDIFYLALLDVFKFHNKLIIPNLIDKIKSDELIYREFLVNDKKTNQIKQLLKDNKRCELLDSLELEPIFVSSTDDIEQNVWNPLITNTEFWSSTGSLNSSASELLIFKFSEVISMVAGFSIKNYKAYFHTNSPVYGAKSIKISIGFSINNYHFTSEAINLINTDDSQTFFFLPYYVVGTYLKIELIGKYQMQDIDSQYYHAIQKINIYGKPLRFFNSRFLNSLIYSYLEEKLLLNYEFYCCLFNYNDANCSYFGQHLNWRFNELYKGIITNNNNENILKFSEFINENSLFILYHPDIIEIIKRLSNEHNFLMIHQMVHSNRESIIFKKYSDFDFLLMNYSSGSAFGMDNKFNYFQFYDSAYTEDKMKILNTIKQPIVNTRIKYILFDGLLSNYEVSDINWIIKLSLKNDLKFSNNAAQKIDKFKLSLMLKNVYENVKYDLKRFIITFLKRIFASENNIYTTFTFYLIFKKTLNIPNLITEDIINLLEQLIYEYVDT